MAAVTTPGLMVPSMASGTVHQTPLTFWRGFRTCVPTTVSRYLCVLLLGLPGSVTSTGPRSSKHPTVWIGDDADPHCQPVNPDLPNYKLLEIRAAVARYTVTVKLDVEVMGLKKRMRVRVCSASFGWLKPG